MNQAARSLPRTKDPDTTIRRLTTLFPEQDRTASRISLAIYARLAQHDRATVPEIAATAGVESEQVAAQLEAWPAVYRDPDGAVIGFWGLTAQPMAHRFVVEGRDRYTWCAWDALFIPDLIGETAVVHSSTPVDSQPVRLSVTPERAVPLDPASPPLHVTFRVPQADEWEEDVIATFCHHVFFLYGDEVDRWLAANPGGVTLSLDDAFRAGQMKNAHQFQR